MRIQDVVYFSPSTKLGELDLSNRKHLVDAFKERIESYYFQPIEVLTKSNSAFAAGAIECLLIDAFARYVTEEKEDSKRGATRRRIIKWCKNQLHIDNQTAKNFYEFFRCGLLHESHIKGFGQFTFDINFANPISIEQDYLIVNPKHLFASLKDYFSNFTHQLLNDNEAYATFFARVKSDFESEILSART